MKLECRKEIFNILSKFSKKDYKVSCFRGSGPGGQHRNKNDTAVRIKHILTNISAESSDNKSQRMNKKSAFEKLIFKLILHYEKIFTTDKLDLNERIRTYHEPRNIVKDHRTGKTNDYKRTLHGDIDCFI